MNEKIKFKIFSVIILLILIVISGYNIWKNNDFLYIEVGEIFTLIIALVFGVYFSNFIDKEKKAKDIVDRLIMEIKVDISEKRICQIKCEEDIHNNLITIRNVANRIDCLKKFSGKFNFKEELDYICSQWTAYEETIGNHYNDVQYLEKSSKDLANKIDLIDSKCNYIVIKLFDY